MAALDASSALEKVTTTSTGGLWRVLGAPARAEVRAPDGTAVALDSSAIGASGSLEASGAERTLVLQERAESGWRAELDGRALEPVTVDGWAQGFVVPADAGGAVQVSRDQPWTLLWQVLLAAGVAGTALIAIPWRLRTRSAEDLYG